MALVVKHSMSQLHSPSKDGAHASTDEKLESELTGASCLDLNVWNEYAWVMP